jgi:transposase-like protein
LAIDHVIKTTEGTTEPELARTLDVHAETAHNIRQKVYGILRRVQQRSLDGVVEADEAYIGGKRPDDPSGRGTTKQCVVALVETEDEEAGNIDRQCMPGAAGENLAPTVRARVQEGSRLWTDDGDGSNGLGANDREVRQPDELEDAEHMHDVLAWSHTVFSNLKRVLYGVHAYVEDGAVQPYLDAFTFRFNHRPFLGKALDKALNGIATTPPRPNERLKRSGRLGAAA